jgi:hypothetical protein
MFDYRRKLTKFHLLLLCFTVLNGCSTNRTWLILNNGDKGKIGSKTRLSSYSKKLRKNIPCAKYKISKIEKKSRKVEKVYHNYISSSPTTNSAGSSISGSGFSGIGSAQKSQKPIYDTQMEDWYEYSYECQK